MASQKNDALRDEAEALRQNLREWGVAYYTEDNPVVEDITYDKAYQRLVEIETTHPELVTPDSPTQQVGMQSSLIFRR